MWKFKKTPLSKETEKPIEKRIVGEFVSEFEKRRNEAVIMFMIIVIIIVVFVLWLFSRFG